MASPHQRCDVIRAARYCPPVRGEFESVIAADLGAASRSDPFPLQLARPIVYECAGDA